MDLANISWIIALAAIYFQLIPLLSGIAYFQSRPIYLKLLCMLTGVSFSADVLQLITPLKIWGNYYKPVETIIFLYLYYRVLDIEGSRKYFIFPGIFMLGFFAIVSIEFPGNRTELLPAIVSAFILIGLVLFFFYRLLQNMPKGDLHRMPMFWISIAILMYSSGTLFLFAIYDHMTQNQDMKDFTRLYIYWDIHNIFSIVTYSLYTVAFWIKPIGKNQPQSDSTG